MTDIDARFQRALEAFDRVNADDPRTESVQGKEEPRELVYSRRMSERLNRFEPSASDELRLAVRAQHIARWRIPRSDYPEGRAGYKRWRTTLMIEHASIAGRILEEAGYDAATVDRVGRLLRKQGLARNPDAQTLEDVACLVFLEHYFDDFAEEHHDDKLVDILKKTWSKMSERGRAAALELRLSPPAKELVGRALEP